MAEISRYFQKPTVQVDTLSLNAANTGAAQIGAAISSFGQDVIDRQNRDEDFKVQKTLLELDASNETTFQDSIENTRDDAEGFESGFLTTIDKNASKATLGSGLSSRGRKKLELGILKQRASGQSRAQAFEAGQRVNSKKRTILQEADNLAQGFFRGSGAPAFSIDNSQGKSVTPGTLESAAAGLDTKSNFVADEPDPISGAYAVPGWNSKFYSPRDFADGRNTADKSGGVKINKSVVAKLDLVTEQFGLGKLQINSGYRSSASNLRRADSGQSGPHTKSKSVDIQVGDLDQPNKNRLYSLLKNQGFNAFGFGDGVLHAEVRPGAGGKGRGGDFEWTYGESKKYTLVPTGTDQAFKGAEQYPFMVIAQLSSRAETGKNNLVEASATIANDTNGSRSYGIFGINSSSSMRGFVDNNADLGLTAPPGSPMFDNQWRALAKRNPKKLIERQLKWHQEKVIKPAKRSLVVNGLGKFSNDERAVAFVSDMIVQYGAAGARKHLLAAATARSVDEFVAISSRSMRGSLDRDFKSYLEGNPDNRKGLLARIDKRASDSLSIASGNGQPITGNVPAWRGPIPDINDIPGFSDKMDRINQMVDTMGGTPSQRAAVRDQLTSQITRSWLASLAATNPPAAMAALHSGKYDNALSIADEVSLTNAAESGWKGFENDIRTAQKALMVGLKSDTNKLVADEVASFVATGVGTGELTPSHKAMMSDTDRENIELAKFQFSISKKISTATNDELPGILEGLEPGGEGFATEQKKFDFARSLVKTRLELQKTDSAGYVVATNERVRDMWTTAMQTGDPDEIQAAIKALRQAQVDQGIAPENIRSITASSMANNQRLLKGAESADKSFRNFIAMKNLYGPEFAAVLKDMEASGGQAGWVEVNEVFDKSPMLAESLSRVTYAGKFDDGVDVGMSMFRDGESAVAKTIFEGVLKRSEIKGITPTGESASSGLTPDQVLQDVVGDTFKDAASGLAAVREAAISYYANTGGLGEPFDEEKYRKAIQAVTGGIVEYNGENGTGKVVPIVPNMTSNQFSNAVRELKAEDLKDAKIGNVQITPSMVQDKIQFKNVEGGKYILEYPGSGAVMNERTGQPFEVDLGALLPKLAKRATKTRQGQPVNSGDNILFPGNKLEIVDPKSGLVTDSISTLSAKPIKKEIPKVQPIDSGDKAKAQKPVKKKSKGPKKRAGRG